MRLTHYTLLFLAALSFQSAHAQGDPKREIIATISGVAKDTIYLANYYGSKLYYADTAVADAKGKVIFKSAKGYKAGMYAIVVPGPKYFEVVVNEPVIELTTDTSDLLGNLVVKRSKENQVFLDYIRYLNAAEEGKRHAT